MTSAILLILRPLLVTMAFSVVKLMLNAALNSADTWLRLKSESTDNKYDDAAYKAFSDNKESILNALERVILVLKGGS